MSQTTYLNIISGQKAGLGGMCARLALTVLSWPYSTVVRVRNRLYSSGVLTVHRAGVPVICVGNLTTGGTGKTPLVVWLCRLLRDRQIRCAILTRGYKSDRRETGGRRLEAHRKNLSSPEPAACGLQRTASPFTDEPALLSASCPGTAVVVNPDRVAGAAEAIRCHGAQALIMDDGFQHRRLARDLDIVAIDATRPFGYSSMGVPPMNSGSRARCPCYGRLLPAGLLREPVTGLRRAHAAVLTRCDLVSPEVLAEIEEKIRRVNPGLVLARSIHVPVALKTGAGAEIGLDRLGGQRLFAFCGIGNPPSFFHTVERLGGMLVGSRAYDDHYRYAAGDLDEIRQEAATKRASLILTTQKDWTKIARLAGVQDSPPVAYLAVELQITAGVQPLTALIDRVLGSTIAGSQLSVPG